MSNPDTHAPSSGHPADAPDTSYWTAYDHFMVEREARAMRRAELYALAGRAWNAVLRRLRDARMPRAHRGAAAH